MTDSLPQYASYDRETVRGMSDGEVLGVLRKCDAMRLAGDNMAGALERAVEAYRRDWQWHPGPAIPFVAAWKEATR